MVGSLVNVVVCWFPSFPVSPRFFFLKPVFTLKVGLSNTLLLLCKAGLIYRQSVTCCLWSPLPVPCALGPVLKEFTFMSFSLCLVPYTLTLGDWIFQLVLLNSYPDVLEDVMQAIVLGAWAVVHGLPHIYPLRRKVCSLFPETKNPWKTCRLQHCLLN